MQHPVGILALYAEGRLRLRHQTVLVTQLRELRVALEEQDVQSILGEPLCADKTLSR